MKTRSLPSVPIASGDDLGFAVRELALIATEAENEDELFADIAAFLARATGADGCDLFLAAEGGSLTLRASTYAPEYVYRCKLGPGIGICGEAFTTVASIFLKERGFSHPKSVQYPGMEERRLEGVAAVPMVLGSRAIGACVLHRERPWPFTSSEENTIRQLVRVATATLETFRSAYRKGVLSTRMRALSEVTRNIASTPYLEEILQLLVNITAQQFNYRVVAVRVLDERRGELVLRAAQAPAKAYQKKRAIKLGESIAGKAISENRPIVVPDVQKEPEYIGHDLAADQGLRSMICIPLVLQDRAVGVMTCYTDKVRKFPPDEVAALETLANQAAIAIEHAKLQVRSTLLQEMHHRVKNNLQQIASLLRLQMRHGEHKSLEQALNDSLTRILAISAVHELLSREDLDHVGLKTLADALVQHHRETLVHPGRRIEFHTMGADVHLPTNQATQVALILNELIQNAVEHGFRECSEGRVRVAIEDYEDEVGLWVANNGDPLPDGFDIATQRHLGVHIVDNLARSLGGRFSLAPQGEWTVAEVRFARVGAE